jgi:hypothetical protein
LASTSRPTSPAFTMRFMLRTAAGSTPCRAHLATISTRAGGERGRAGAATGAQGSPSHTNQARCSDLFCFISYCSVRSRIADTFYSPRDEAGRIRFLVATNRICKLLSSMSASGHELPKRDVSVESALSPTTDIDRRSRRSHSCQKRTCIGCEDFSSTSR